MICSDFTVRRRVVIDKDIQQLLANEGFKEPGDKMRVGPLIFHHPGHILNNTSNFHTRNIIYPFDYSASRMYWSTELSGARCLYHCSIDVMNEKPLFRLSYKKLDDQIVELENPCLDTLWKDVLDSIAQVRSKTSDTLSLHVSFHPGSFLHGITERSMLRIIEGLPGSDKLEGYTFCYGRIETVTLEHLVPFNPSQSARTEKYTKHTKRFATHVCVVHLCVYSVRACSIAGSTIYTRLGSTINFVTKKFSLFFAKSVSVSTSSGAHVPRASWICLFYSIFIG